MAGAGGPLTIVPLFLLYDYSFRPDGTRSKAEALALAYETGVVCSDEAVLYHDPYPGRDAWCHTRVEGTERRLTALRPGTRTVLVSHFPLTRAPTRVLKYPEFAQWCGTERTADWHVRFRAQAVVYGHLHIPGTTWQDGVRFEEVSFGYPEELTKYPNRPRALRQIFPADPLRYLAGSTTAVTRNPLPASQRPFSVVSGVPPTGGPGTSRRAVNAPARGSTSMSADWKPSHVRAMENHAL